MSEIERQLSAPITSEKIETVQDKLDALIRIALHNEQKQNNFQRYELLLLNSVGLIELLTLILEQHRKQFHLTDVSLLLLDPEYELQRLLDAESVPESWQDRLLFTDNKDDLHYHYHIRHRPRLTAFSEQYQPLFPKAKNLASVAILPLTRHNKIIGSLNLGSRQADRFQAGIATQFLEHLTAVISSCLENARLQENIKLLGLRDPLTNINNRRFFDQRVVEEVSLAHRNNTPLSCLFIDLDHFKHVNDHHGHQVGDTVLKQTAQLFNDIMRTTDVLARYGGEEFVILLANTNANSAYEIAERLRSLIESIKFPLENSEFLKQTISVGLATLDNDSPIRTSQQLIQAADQAVYSAKTAGRNRVHNAI